ncbi:MAG: hypothetical protein MUC65_00495 [Pontiellaceae bacterium]|jgi:hypothetical protein|nr:hypothetical protein [Pontiellaceae bacterium]
MKKATAVGFMSVLLTAGTVSAEVSVKFSNSNLPPNTTNELGVLTLSFNVDASGNVTLDASASNPMPIIQDAVNAWDGPVGAISYSGAFNTRFSLDFYQVGGSGLRLTNLDGGGLGVAGKSAWRIDRPGLEFIEVSTTIKAGIINFRSVSWGYCTNEQATMLLRDMSGAETNMVLFGPSGLSTNHYGSCDVSDQNLILRDNEFFRFGNTFPGLDAEGYALAGFTFDVIETAVSTPTTVGFITDTETLPLILSENQKPGNISFQVCGFPGIPASGCPIYTRL